MLVSCDILKELASLGNWKGGKVLKKRWTCWSGILRAGDPCKEDEKGERKGVKSE